MNETLFRQQAVPVGRDGLVAAIVAGRAEEDEEAVSESVNQSMCACKQMVSPDLLQRLGPQTLTCFRREAAHRIRNFIVATAVMCCLVVQVLVILHLDAGEAGLTFRSQEADIDVKRGMVSRISLLASASAG